MSTIYDQVHKFLDEDERLIYPEAYEKNKELYDLVRGYVYLVLNKTGNKHTYDWAWESALSRLLKQPNFVVLKKLVLVRVRDPKLNRGWIISSDEYKENPNAYTVLDRFVVAVNDTEKPQRIVQLPVDDYHAVAYEYDILDTCYLVISRFKP